MQNIIQQLALMASQAEESPEERHNRLTNVAEDTGADPETLYDVEQEVRGYGYYVANQNTEKVSEAEEKLAQFAPMMGMDPQAAQEQVSAETVIKIASMHALGRPERTAQIVKTLHESFERHGLYDELGTETPRPGIVQPVIPADKEGE